MIARLRRATAAVVAAVALAGWAGVSSAQAVPAVTLIPARGAAALASDTAASSAAAIRAARPGEASAAPARDRASPRTLAVTEADAGSEFERLATQANGGTPVRRFGGTAPSRELATAAEPTADMPARVPSAYVMQVGDEISVSLWGSVDADWRLRIDRAGRVMLPRAGPVPLAGARAGELPALLRTRLERVFRGFELAAAVTEVSPVRVHVTGFAERPGVHTVPGLATISSALALAGGPAAGGSSRRIRLVRGERTVAVFDLYALLAEGSRRDDALLEPDDVLHVEAAGPQAAMLGSVNRVAVFEFVPGETVADLLRLAGGFNPVADRERVTLERLGNRSSGGALELALPRELPTTLADGDLLRALSRADAALPSQQRNKRVKVEGEVLRPGDYLLPPEATLADALAAAGGTTAAAFVFGTELRRESVRLTQQLNYERALQELETEIERSAAARTQRDDANAQYNDAAARALLARLRARQPEGRIVLDLSPQAMAVPALALEDRDQIKVPSRGQSVGVFGSVFNAGSFVQDGARTLGDYLGRAGGPTVGADYKSVFVVRANGSVLSARQGGAWSGLERFEREPALPGDTLFVPEKLDRVGWVQGAKDWTQILYQFGLGIAALLAIR